MSPSTSLHPPNPPKGASSLPSSAFYRTLLFDWRTFSTSVVDSVEHAIRSSRVASQVRNVFAIFGGISVLVALYLCVMNTGGPNDDACILYDVDTAAITIQKVPSYLGTEPIREQETVSLVERVRRAKKSDDEVNKSPEQGETSERDDEGRGGANQEKGGGSGLNWETRGESKGVVDLIDVPQEQSDERDGNDTEEVNAVDSPLRASPAEQEGEESGRVGETDASSEFPSLEEVVEKVAMRGGKEGGTREGEKLILLVTANDGFMDFLLNWFSFVRDLGLAQHVLIIAEDKVSFKNLNKVFPGQTVYLDDSTKGSELSVDSLAYMSAPYLRMVSRRPHYFQLLLKLNVSFLYSDIDMVWLRDPLPFLVDSRANASMDPFDVVVMHDDVEYDGVPLSSLAEATRAALKGPHDMKGPAVKTIHVDGEFGTVPDRSDDALLTDRLMGPFPQLVGTEPFHKASFGLCTCLMYVRPTEGGRAIVDTWMDFIRAKIELTPNGTGGTTNQPIFNNAMFQMKRKGKKLGLVLNLGVLPTHYFPSGNVFFAKEDWRREMLAARVVPIIVHNNYVKGHHKKLKRFVEHGLWRLPPLTDAIKEVIEGVKQAKGNEEGKVETVGKKLTDEVIDRETEELFKSLGVSHRQV